MCLLKNSLFIKENEILTYFGQQNLNVPQDLLDKLFNLKIITVVFRNSEKDDKYVLRRNIDIITNFLKKYSDKELDEILSKIEIDYVVGSDYENDKYALLSNLLDIYVKFGKDSEKIDNQIEQYWKMKKLINSEKKYDFARSAYYMGAKVNLRSFILESMSEINIDTHILVDLMTGSGAMAGAFANYSQTIASDAMSFSKYLSLVQGGGYTQERAIQVIKKIKEKYLKNYADLQLLYGDLMEEEDTYLLSDDTDEKITSEYLEMINNTRLLSAENNLLGFMKKECDEKIKIRKENNLEYPYLLFTEYFANVYFGINQSVQIDSIRYAVEFLDEFDRSWALGALISACSHVSSTHAAHFAQPIALVDKEKKVKHSNIKKVLLKRKLSVWREFEATFLSLAAESKTTPNIVEFYNGPWREAIQCIKQSYISKDIMFYVDAPYTREEYSRYYHVLETLVKYNYPSIFGKGRQPYKDTKTGERYTSEFFTKTDVKVENIFIELFVEILSSGWKCAWSYSNNGMASIVNVLDGVASKIKCSIRVFSTSYKHKSQDQAKAKNKDVYEYVILMMPQLIRTSNLEQFIELNKI